MKKLLPLLMVFAILASGCESASKILQDASNVFLGSEDGTPSSLEIGNGLKQALEVGISAGANRLSATDGYFGNTLVKVLLPPEAQKVENTLRSIGLGNMVDKTIESLNRGAEKAAKEAAPIFVSAIKSMTIQDASSILLSGNQDAATKYLKSSTSSQLTAAFTPVIEKSLNEVNATKYWSEMITRYNKIPLVEKVNPDLTAYVTDKALDGLFLMVAKEELKIRENVGSRTTDLLQKVFGYADTKK